MQCRDRPQTLAMAQKHTKLLEIGIGQIGQDLCVDRVVAKRRSVLRQIQLLQPSNDVHAVPRRLVPGRAGA
jgi:hypothetical protein